MPRLSPSASRSAWPSTMPVSSTVCVLDGVVVVHLGVALDAHREVDERVARERAEHVVEEAHARLDVGGTGAVEVHGEADVRL